MTTKAKRPRAHPRKPRKGTVRLAGRMFTKGCADLIKQVAEEDRQSPTAVIVDVLEGWAKRAGRRRRRKSSKRGASIKARHDSVPPARS